MRLPNENRPGAKIHRPFSWLSNARHRLSALWDILKDAVLNFENNGETNQAAAISLYAILSIIPLFILTILVAGYIFGSFPEIQSGLKEGIRRFSPSAAQGVLTQLGAVEDKLRVLGWIGIITLIWFSSMIFGAIETAFNVIFRARNPRSYFSSKALAIAMIPLAWAVGITSVMITSIATLLSSQPVLAEIGIPYLPLLRGTLFRFVIPYVVTVFFFTLVYKIIPTVRIPLVLALTGSAVFSGLMEMAKHLFAWYVANYTRYNIIFGSLETVVILIIWVFYVALILLFCAELMSSYLRRDLLLLEKAFFGSGQKKQATDERLFHKFGRIYPAGSYIFREGEHDQNMYYILSGRIRVEKRAGHIKKVISEMEAGHYFGEMAPLIDAPRAASAIAIENSTVAVIDRRTFQHLLRENEGVSLGMLREFSNRVRHANEALEEATNGWVRSMVILYLIRMWSFGGGREPLKGLSEYTGKSPGELEDVLEGLAREGVLTLEENRIVAFHEETAWKSLLGHRGDLGSNLYS